MSHLPSSFFFRGDDLTDDGLLVVGAFTSAYSNAFLAYSKLFRWSISACTNEKNSEEKDQRIKNSFLLLVMVFFPKSVAQTCAYNSRTMRLTSSSDPARQSGASHAVCSL